MDNQGKGALVVTFTRDEYRNLQLFLKSLNMVRLAQNFDTDMLSMAIAQTVQAINQATGGQEDIGEQVPVEMTEEMKKNLDVFLQNLNLTRLSNSVDTVTLSLAIVQVAQAVSRAEPKQEQVTARQEQFVEELVPA